MFEATTFVAVCYIRAQELSTPRLTKLCTQGSALVTVPSELRMDPQTPAFQMCEGCQLLLSAPLPSRAGGCGHRGLCTCLGATVALQDGADPAPHVQAGRALC